MRRLLEQNNYDLINEIEKIEFSLRKKELDLPSELKDFYSWSLSVCVSLKKQVNENLADISKNQENILTDVLSHTKVVAWSLRTLNQLFLNPILRISVSDRLCLKLLYWLHKEHPKTAGHFFVMTDGAFASLPYPPRPTVYFVPPSAQERLLYLPLLFHEFGHLLYAFHKDEMDALVKELQEEIARRLEPSVHRNDKYSSGEDQWRKNISEIWYEWTQEIFCDAVGLIIGGPAFLHAFSMYFRILGREEFQLPKESLAKRDHPVSWIRIKILINRAEILGLNEVAQDLQDSWNKIAANLKIAEDYFGFYNHDFLINIQQKIDDMLVEASPRQYLESEIDMADSSNENVSPIKLLNSAWHRFYSNPTDYNAWENNGIYNWLGLNK